MSVIQIVPVQRLAGKPQRRVLNPREVTIIDPCELAEELRDELSGPGGPGERGLRVNAR